MNLHTSSLSSLDNRYTFPFLSINPFFISIAFCHPNFPYFGLHCLPHFSGHLIIFTFPVYSFSIPLVVNIYLCHMLDRSPLIKRNIYVSHIYISLHLLCYNQCLKDTSWKRAKGNDDIIGYAIVVSVSASCSRYYILVSTSCIMTHSHCILRTLSSWIPIIYRVDTALYLYTLPIASTLTSFSSICLSCNLSQV